MQEKNMLKVNELKLEKGEKIYLRENWHDKILTITESDDFPYEFSFLEKVKNETSKENAFIFTSDKNNKRKSKIKIALSCNIVKYLFATEVPDANIGFSFREYLPFENTDILITNIRNISNVQPATFEFSVEEISLPKINKILYLDFRLNYLNGSAFTSLSYYTKVNKATWKFLFNPDVSYMTDYEKMFQDTFIHKKYVKVACKKLSDYLENIGAKEHAKKLMEKAVSHDISKISCDDELRALSMIINDKTTLKDSKCSLSKLKEDSIHLHWKHNRHHPEFFETPEDMERIDMMEMVCDWYARSLQYGTNFLEFVKDKQETRFKFPTWMFAEIWHYCEVLAR